MTIFFPVGADRGKFIDHLKSAGLNVFKHEDTHAWHVKIKHNTHQLFQSSGTDTVIPVQLKPMLKNFMKQCRT